MNRSVTSDPAASFQAVDQSRVLIVDDNRDLADSLVALLRVQGICAMRVYDGISALAVVPAFKPQIVLLDLQMPGMSGTQVAKSLRQIASGDLRIVAHTATDIRGSKSAAYFDEYLLKPVPFSQLLKVMERETRADA